MKTLLNLSCSIFDNKPVTPIDVVRQSKRDPFDTLSDRKMYRQVIKVKPAGNYMSLARLSTKVAAAKKAVKDAGHEHLFKGIASKSNDAAILGLLHTAALSPANDGWN